MSTLHTGLLRIMMGMSEIGLVLVSAFLQDIATASDRDRLLLEAIRRGQPEKVKSLLSKGADANAREEYGDTALVNAVHKGNLEIVRLLLDKGVDINAADSGGYTPLMRSVGRPPEIMSLLLNNGADVNAKTDDSLTALKTAQKMGFKEIVALLKAHGARE